MAEQPLDAQLEAYLDEALPPEEMAEIEQALRRQPELAERLRAILGRRDAGMHSLGAIWRRHRLTCASREQLGSYLMGVLPEAERSYLEFHLEVAGCRYCRANLLDLKDRQAEQAEAAHTRRRKYFQSSAGYLRSADD